MFCFVCTKVSQLCAFFLSSFSNHAALIIHVISRTVVTFCYVWAVFNDFSSPFEIADSWRFVFIPDCDKVF